MKQAKCNLSSRPPAPDDVNTGTIGQGLGEYIVSFVTSLILRWACGSPASGFSSVPLPSVRHKIAPKSDNDWLAFVRYSTWFPTFGFSEADVSTGPPQVHVHDEHSYIDPDLVITNFESTSEVTGPLLPSPASLPSFLEFVSGIPFSAYPGRTTQCRDRPMLATSLTMSADAVDQRLAQSLKCERRKKRKGRLSRELEATFRELEDLRASVKQPTTDPEVLESGESQLQTPLCQPIRGKALFSLQQTQTGSRQIANTPTCRPVRSASAQWFPQPTPTLAPGLPLTSGQVHLAPSPDDTFGGGSYAPAICRPLLPSLGYGTWDSAYPPYQDLVYHGAVAYRHCPPNPISWNIPQPAYLPQPQEHLQNLVPSQPIALFDP